MSLNSSCNTTPCHDEQIVAPKTKKFSLPKSSTIQLDKLLKRFKTTEPCYNEPIVASKTQVETLKKQFKLPKSSTIQLDKLLKRFN